MADVQPFQAIRYDTRQGNDLSDVVAPPYDVLSEADKQRLLRRRAENIVAVDLPHTPPKSAGPAEAYQRAADLLRGWLARGVLVRESAPAVYAYQQTFEHSGQRLIRRGLIARVRAEQFRASPTGIFPHEQTFSGPKEDRLALTRAARCQLSPIFGLFADETHAITDGLYSGLPPTPTMHSRLDHVEHEVWRVDSPARIEPLTAAMRDRPIFIADGHHRYTTALNYLAWLEAQGPLPADHPARYVMFVCVSMHDPGLAILPTHRVITARRFDPARLAGRLAEAFDVRRVNGSAEQLETQVLANGAGWFAAKFADGEQGWLLRLKDAKVLDRFEPQRGEAYRRLDVAVLHRYIIQEALAPLAGEPVGIEYPHSGADVGAALANRQLDGSTAFGASGAEAVTAKAAGAAGAAGAAAGSAKVAFLLAPTPLAAVRDVCLSGELMPQKSTYFYPKLATGLTLYDLSQ